MGGAGEDRFVVENITDGLDDILDFNLDDYDRLLVSTALSGFESGTDVIGDFVRVEQGGNDTLVLISPDGADSDFTPVFRLVDQIADSDNLTTYGMTFKPIDPDLLPLRSNPSLSSDAIHASSSPAISADGRLVAFQSQSDADQFDGGQIDGNQALNEIFIKDFATGTIIRGSDNVNGEPPNNSEISMDDISPFANAFDPAISSDARFVAFASDPTILYLTIPIRASTFS